MARKEKFEVTYISNGLDKTTKTTTVIAANRNEAKAMVEARNNRVIAVVFQKAVYD